MYRLSDSLDPNKIFLVKFSELEGRLDPSFYKYENWSLFNKLSKSKHYKLKDIVSFSDETWDQKSYFDNKFPYIEIGAIDLFTGNITNIQDVSVSEAPSRAKMIVRNNDIIVSLTRPARGAISLIENKQQIKIASTGFVVIRDVKEDIISRKVLFYMLRLPIILQQMGQRSSGGNYPAITQEELGNILIPYISDDSQKVIQSLFENAFLHKQQKETQAASLLAGIDDYLLQELGISLPEHDNSLENRMFTVRFGDIAGGRFDPNYTSKYKYLINQKACYKFTSLKDIIIGVPQYGSNEEAINGNSDFDFRYIRITDIDEIGNLKENTWMTAANIETKYVLNYNDILIARSGSVGKCYIHKEKKRRSIFAGYLIRFILDDKKVNHDFLFLYCNSSIYKFWVNAVARPAVQANINAEEFQSLPVPLPPLEKQNKIAHHIQSICAKAKRLRREGREILEQAREAVERMVLGE